MTRNQFHVLAGQFVKQFLTNAFIDVREGKLEAVTTDVMEDIVVSAYDITEVLEAEFQRRDQKCFGKKPKKDIDTPPIEA